MIKNTPVQKTVMFPIYEPRNGATEEESVTHNPPIGPADGEERSNQLHASDDFFDTGGTLGDFCCTSKQIAQVLRNV